MPQNLEDNRKKWPGESDHFQVGDVTIDPKHVWEPPTDYPAGGQYHKVHATTWRCGHSVEVDETPGGERIRIIHSNGSYVEMQHDGSVIHRANNHMYESIAGDSNVRVKGARNVKVDGATNVYVGGNVRLEAGGDMDVTVDGKTTWKSSGPFVIETPHLDVRGEQMSHNDINVGSTHEHSGITSGPEDTGPPLPL